MGSGSPRPRAGARNGGENTGSVPSAAEVATLPVPEVYAARGTSPGGLRDEEAAERRVHTGENTLPAAAGPAWWRELGSQFTDLFAVVLLVASGITFLAWWLEDPRDSGTLQLAVAILAVVLLNAGIGFGQQYSAERTAQSLQAMVPHRCRVRRDGEERELPASALVPGDVVVLEAGDAVPADCRLVRARDVTVNNAALTGESEPVGRSSEPVAGGEVLHARSCVLLGTDVVTGTAQGVVTATGGATEFGRLFRLAAAAPRQRSPLQRQVASMARRVAGVALAVGAVVFAVRMPVGQPLVETFVFALGVMVALVPEGLPATLSVSLAIGVRRMARRHAVVKRLLAVEALGSTTVVCTDKTGTLTQAQMTVVEVWTGGVSHAVTGVGYGPEGAVAGDGRARELLRAAGLCCNARLVPPAGREGRRVLGDTTEGALLVAAGKAGVDLAAEESAAPRIAEYPFDAVRKLMSTVHRRPEGDLILLAKGAPAELLARSTALGNTAPGGDAEAEPLTAESRAAVGAAADALASRGLRVLGVASRELPAAPPDRDAAEEGLTFLGLVGMLDPPRTDVRDAVTACRRAGIRVVMVTGDHPLTAEAVARRVGLVREAHPVVLTGTELDGLDDTALDALLTRPGELLLCRFSPEHKTRVVTALQRNGEITAVTGDGANDAPALKHADIGVAMGASGTDAAREAAVMVLLDDSFSSIAAAVRLGRSVYQNIRKFLIYLFTSNVAELVPVLAATFTGFPLVPVSAVQILAIDLGSDVLPALALGAEPPEPDVMDRPPRPRRERLFSRGVLGRTLFLGGIQATAVCAVFFWHIGASGIPYAEFTEDDPVYREAVTLAHATIVVSQFFASLAVRSERESLLRLGLWSNPWLLGAGCVGVGLMAAISYAPPLQAVFNTAPLSLGDWAVTAACGAVLLLAEELRKAVVRRRRPADGGENRCA
ncbi:cation-transporting P-type ATPase [Streptomyces sp. JJ36]|uniref:cation-translocating P-type ATPase n=1 Tax=Streptomyces sp. JJ36 TaxID=2736645 RepID=UPI001F266A29|nr:cation-transporting P-type ATPase [Streptomyces sp. JJ36]MCF6525274.1 cation-transporting P-type ATPase [Streptomyces sp. JJ36]